MQGREARLLGARRAAHPPARDARAARASRLRDTRGGDERRRARRRARQCRAAAVVLTVQFSDAAASGTPRSHREEVGCARVRALRRAPLGARFLVGGRRRSAGMRCAARTGGSVPRGIGSRRSSAGSRSIVCPAGITLPPTPAPTSTRARTMRAERPPALQPPHLLRHVGLRADVHPLLVDVGHDRVDGDGEGGGEAEGEEEAPSRVVVVHLRNASMSACKAEARVIVERIARARKSEATVCAEERHNLQPESCEPHADRDMTRPPQISDSPPCAPPTSSSPALRRAASRSSTPFSASRRARRSVHVSGGPRQVAVHADHLRAGKRAAKALEVRSRLIAAGEAPPSVVVGADTVVDQGGAILEKPKSEAQATEMLGRLSGSTHAVHTGVALLYRDGSEACFCESSEVNFCDLATGGHRRVRCVRRADGQSRRVRHPGPRRRVRDRHTRLLLQRDGLPDAQILRNARRGAVGSGELRNF